MDPASKEGCVECRAGQGGRTKPNQLRLEIGMAGGYCSSNLFMYLAKVLSDQAGVKWKDQGWLGGVGVLYPCALACHAAANTTVPIVATTSRPANPASQPLFFTNAPKPQPERI